MNNMKQASTEYPISPTYCSKWNIVHAIREIIANARDESNICEMKWENGFGIVEDNGSGIPKAHLVLGEGAEKGSDKIGQFKEGLKIAGLVFARNDLQFFGSTVEFDFIFDIIQSDFFECPVMRLSTIQNERTEGTYIAFECKQEDFEEACSLFLGIEESKTGSILKNQEGKLYINGVYVQEINSMFGYNIIDKESANRDRSVLDMNKVNGSISTFLSATDKKEIIKDYICSKKQFLEHSIFFSPQGINRVLWKSIIEEIYGEKCCVDDEYGHLARERGHQTIDPLTYTMGTVIHQIGIPFATEIVRKKENLDYSDITHKLSDDLLQIYLEGRRFAEICSGESIEMKVVEKLSFDNDVYSAVIDGQIYTCLKALEKGIQKYTASILHEYVHEKTNSGDATALFESYMTDLLGLLAMKLVGECSQDVVWEPQNF